MDSERDIDVGPTGIQVVVILLWSCGTSEPSEVAPNQIPKGSFPESNNLKVYRTTKRIVKNIVLITLRMREKDMRSAVRLRREKRHAVRSKNARKR